MLAQRVEVYAKNGAIPGVVSSIPPHLLTDAERAKPMDIKICSSMLVLTIKKMQWLWVFVQTIHHTNLSIHTNGKSEKIMAKAWDNRYGCGLAIELMKEVQHEN